MQVISCTHKNVWCSRLFYLVMPGPRIFCHVPWCLSSWSPRLPRQEQRSKETSQVLGDDSGHSPLARTGYMPLPSCKGAWELPTQKHIQEEGGDIWEADGGLVRDQKPSYWCRFPVMLSSFLFYFVLILFIFVIGEWGKKGKVGL